MTKKIRRFFMKERELDLKSFNGIKPIDPLKYCGEYHFILKHGKIYKFHPRRSYVKNSPTPVLVNECYCNSIQYAMHSGLRYVEGYGFSQKRGLMDHAWCINEHNNVRDVTWNDGIFYFGVEIPIDYVIERNNGETDYFLCKPILREPDNIFSRFGDTLLLNLAAKSEKEINPRCLELLKGEIVLA